MILHPTPFTDAVTVDVWIKTGGRHEAPDVNGISHFLEHMVFKGTESIGPGDLDRAIEGRGGITNAATGYDHTHFYITVAAADLADTLPYLAGILTAARIPADEFERERQVILEEMRRAADNPDYQAMHLLLSTVYPYHPYGRPILGTVNSVTRLTPEILRHYHRQWYRPEHMTVVVVGGIDPDSTLHLIEETFQFPDPLPTEWPSLNWMDPDPQLSEVQRLEAIQPRTEQARLMLAWPTVSAQNWDDACGLDCLASILGDGRTSRLVQHLREERGWVRGIGSSSTTQRDHGLFQIMAYLDPAQLEIVEAAILAEIERLQQDRIQPDELARTRRILSHELIFAAEAPSQLASMFGYYTSLQDLSLIQHYLERIQTITAAELQTLAQRYLSTQAHIVVSLKPSSRSSGSMPLMTPRELAVR